MKTEQNRTNRYIFRTGPVTGICFPVRTTGKNILFFLHLYNQPCRNTVTLLDKNFLIAGKFFHDRLGIMTDGDKFDIRIVKYFKFVL